MRGKPLSMTGFSIIKEMFIRSETQKTNPLSSRLLFVFVLVLGYPLLCYAQPSQDYELKSIVFNSSTQAHFTFEANIQSNATATLEITAARAKADNIQESLTTVLPATLKRQQGANANQPDVLTIDVQNTSGTTKPNTLTFDVTIAAAAKRLAYRISGTRSPSSIDATLALELDDPKTDADESDVEVFIRGETALLKVPNGVDLSARNGSRITLEPFRGGSIDTEEMFSLEYEQTTVKRTLRIKNLYADLPKPDAASLFDNQGKFVSNPTIAADLLKDESVYLTLRNIPAAEIKVHDWPGSDDISVAYEQVKITDNGQLIYIPWLGKRVTMDNKLSHDVTIRVQRLPTLKPSDYQDVHLPANKEKEVLVVRKREGDPGIALEEIERRLDLIDVFLRDPQAAPPVTRSSFEILSDISNPDSELKGIIADHKAILVTMKKIASLGLDKAAAERALTSMSQLPNPDADEIERLRKRIEKIEGEIKNQETSEKMQRVTLIGKLFP